VSRSGSREIRSERRLLIVDDDICMSSLIRRVCESDGVLIEACLDCSTTLSTDNLDAYDLVLLDHKLPDGDGLTLCRLVRGRGYRGIVIMFSQFDTTADQLRAFEAGADDFVSKNEIEPELLRARIMAHVRRISERSLPSRSFRTSTGEIRFSCALNLATVNGELLPLTPLETRLLGLLADAYPTVVPRRRLIAGAWDGTRASDHTLHNHLSSLRAKMRSAGLGLESRRGEGYALVVLEKRPSAPMGACGEPCGAIQPSWHRQSSTK
jgi:DNA-binding response OmpR family regulator